MDLEGEPTTPILEGMSYLEINSMVLHRYNVRPASGTGHPYMPAVCRLDCLLVYPPADLWTNQIEPCEVLVVPSAKSEPAPSR